MTGRTASRVFFLLTSALALSAQTYEIKPDAGSRFALEVFKTGLMNGKKHIFTFERYQGTLTYQAATPESSKLELTIEAASIVCKDTWVSAKDLKKVQEHAENEMLMIAKYPHLRFTSAKISRNADNSFDVAGNLTMRDTTKPATVNVRMEQGPDDKLVFIGKSVVNMKDFGMKPPGAVLGMIGTKPEMTVEFRVTGVRKK